MFESIINIYKVELKTYFIFKAFLVNSSSNKNDKNNYT